MLPLSLISPILESGSLIRTSVFTISWRDSVISRLTRLLAPFDLVSSNQHGVPMLRIVLRDLTGSDHDTCLYKVTLVGTFTVS